MRFKDLRLETAGLGFWGGHREGSILSGSGHEKVP